MKPEISKKGHLPSLLIQAMDPGRRIVIAGIDPWVEGYSVKRCVGDRLVVEADIFADGHEQLAAAVMVRAPGRQAWDAHPMVGTGNDRWQAEVALDESGLWEFSIEAWLDVFGGFARDTARKNAVGMDLTVEAEEGRLLVAAARSNAKLSARVALSVVLDEWPNLSLENRIALLLAPETANAVRAANDRPFLTYSAAQTVDAERRIAGFASWYELFPRSQGDGGHHGTLRGVIAQLPRIQAMGFDVLYMTPIHPIGLKNRKGRNNALNATAGDPGSPYAIGGAAGGHDSIHPELGTIADFRELMVGAQAHGMELALDMAVQMSPDHPWVKDHPQWFSVRPDGSMRCAENPPKKYEDIVNPDFYTDPALWVALRDIFLYWAGEGVRIFRVDNPHTKPLPFWQWLIAEVRRRYPDTIFLAEAFTRPKRMYQLARIGFSESYTYFTWRNSKRELTDYLIELNSAPIRDIFRPHFFVNTPDINPLFLQTGGRPAFLIRAVLAATLVGLWGIYSGYEICESKPLPGKEEYKDSEKYQLRQRDFAAAGNIVAELAALNSLRRAEPALQSFRNVNFYNAFNDNILYYGKSVSGREDRILVAVNLDPHNVQECDFEIPLWEWKLPDHETLLVQDLLHGHKFSWTGKIQHVRLAPAAPYAIWRVQPAKAAS